DFASNVYHSPADDLSLPLNLDAAIQHVDLLFGVIDELVNSETEPEWNASSPFRYARVLSRKGMK
ncbi:MAG: hypothetical protein Q8S39_05265, partial [Ignavibacteria bacterium]|nr:hypothetical protein [Ignavibacteria bacterium]